MKLGSRPPGATAAHSPHRGRDAIHLPRIGGSLVDESRLNIGDGVIYYKLYGQDGKFIPMVVRDTPDMRRFVSWVQIHDRYTGVAK